MKATTKNHAAGRLGRNIQAGRTGTHRKTATYVAAVASLVILCFASATWAGVYTITVGNEELRFAPQAERGYVVKLAERTGGITALSDISVLDPDHTKPVGGTDQHGIYIVENAGLATANEQAVTRLKQQGRVAFAAPLFSSCGETVGIIPEIVVRMVPGTEMEELAALCEKVDCQIAKRMEFTEQEYLLEVLGPDAEAVFAAVGQLSQAACVEWACPNTAFQPNPGDQVVPDDGAGDPRLRIASAGEDANIPGVFPNDEYFPMQWHLHNTGQSGGTPGADIRAPEAWEITTGDPNIVVAVLDCGVDASHPDLINNLVAGYDFYENDAFPDPALVQAANLHGTACAGLVAAQGNNSIGVTGVTWNCKVMPIRAGSVSADGTWHTTTEADTATAIRWSADHGADVLSNSWYFYSSPRPIVRSAIVDITRAGGIGRNGRGCVVVCAAANANSSVYYPATHPEVIAVGATDHKDLRWGYSNYGPELDITAPGGPAPRPADGDVFAIWTTDIAGSPGGNGVIGGLHNTDYIPFGGTSAATPIVAGVAALILSVEPNLTNDEVRHFIERSAKDLGNPGRDGYYGWGRVDARGALDMVLAKRADLNDDWKVDEADQAILVLAMETGDLAADIAPVAKRDSVVDTNDLELLTRYLGTVVPEPGLIAHWDLDEVEGDIARESINHHDGTLEGGAVWQPAGGKLGGALQLDGVDDCVNTEFVRDPAEGPFSILAWVKGEAVGQVIVSQQYGADWLAASAAGQLMTGLSRPAGGRNKPQPLVSGSVIIDGEWHRVGMVWDTSNRILYVDDIEVARGPESNLAGSTGGLTLGASSRLAVGTFWSGLIDDVRIYDRVVKP